MNSTIYELVQHLIFIYATILLNWLVQLGKADWLNQAIYHCSVRKLLFTTVKKLATFTDLTIIYVAWVYVFVCIFYHQNPSTKFMEHFDLRFFLHSLNGIYRSLYSKQDKTVKIYVWIL